jgi:hypothetical protein
MISEITKKGIGVYRYFMIFAKDLLVPLGIYFFQWRGKFSSWLDVLQVALFSLSYTFFIYFTTEWVIYSVYLRTFIPSLWFIATVLSIKTFISRKRKGETVHVSQTKLNFGRLFLSLLTLFFAGFVFWAYTGSTLGQKAVELQFPLKNGTFSVINGGDSPLLNNVHHAYPPVPQKYAVDIVKLDAYGRRANGFFPTMPDDYWVFGEPVYAPLAGIVIEKVDQYPDSLNTENKVDEITALGNYLVIRSDSIDVVIAHLQQNSLIPSIGDTLILGEQIARVGCSGDVREPLLHLHATVPTNDPRILKYWGRSGTPITFNTRFLIRNSVIRN